MTQPEEDGAKAARCGINEMTTKLAACLRVLILLPSTNNLFLDFSTHKCQVILG